MFCNFNFWFYFARGKPNTCPASLDDVVAKCKENKQTCAQVGGVAAVVFIIYMFFSDGDFSFLMTLSSLLSLASFLNVGRVIFAKNSVTGVSCRMMECYVVAFFMRLISILSMDGYLPYDRTGDYIYRATEIGCFLSSCFIVTKMDFAGQILLKIDISNFHFFDIFRPISRQ